MAGLPWDSQEEQLLRECHTRGDTAQETAALLKRTVAAIHNKAQQLGIKWGTEKTFTVTKPPSANRSLPEILKGQAEAYRRKADRHEAKKGIPIEIHEVKPYGLLMFGDPHVGDNGADIEYLSYCLDLVKSTPGLFGINIGDLCNFWIGRLGRLYAHQHTTDDEEIELARWMLKEIPWLFVILGNHDKWSPIAQMLCHETETAYVSHGGRFHIRCGSHELKIDARHDHKGRSQFNAAHGQIRRSYRGSDCDIIVGGHIHTGAYTLVKNGVSGFTNHCSRLGSFKRIDEFADSQHFDQDDLGPAQLYTINPEDGQIQFWSDVDAGAEYLTWLRSKTV